MAQGKQETNVIVPRNYGVIVKSGSNSHFYDPARYVIGHAILCTQPQLLHMLKRWQLFKSDETRKKEEGVLLYDPRFPVDGIEELLECPVDVAEEKLVRGIQKTERSKNLWVVGGTESLKEGKLYGKSLKSIVKSKSSGYNDVHIGNPFLGIDGIIRHSDIYCSAPEGDYESQKNLRAMCSHAAALETAQFMQIRGMRDFSIDYGTKNTRQLMPTLAFDFVSNPFLSNLEVDVLVSHYIKKESLYSINRRLTDIVEPYSAALSRTAENGLVRFAVMRQKAIDEGRSGTYQQLENRWMRKIRERVKELGFRRMPFYTIVFKDSPYEMIAERYENCKGNEVVEIACSSEFAPIVVKKSLKGAANMHNSPLINHQNPFSNLAFPEGKMKNNPEYSDAVDDCTRRECGQIVFVPESIYLPKKMQSVYRRLAREAMKEGQEKKQFGLVF